MKKVDLHQPYSCAVIARLDRAIQISYDRFTRVKCYEFSKNKPSPILSLSKGIKNNPVSWGAFGHKFIGPPLWQLSAW